MSNPFNCTVFVYTGNDDKMFLLHYLRQVAEGSLFCWAGAKYLPERQGWRVSYNVPKEPHNETSLR